MLYKIVPPLARSGGSQNFRSIAAGEGDSTDGRMQHDSGVITCKQKVAASAHMEHREALHFGHGQNVGKLPDRRVGRVVTRTRGDMECSDRSEVKIALQIHNFIM